MLGTPEAGTRTAHVPCVPLPHTPGGKLPCASGGTGRRRPVARHGTAVAVYMSTHTPPRVRPVLVAASGFTMVTPRCPLTKMAPGGRGTLATPPRPLPPRPPRPAPRRARPPRPPPRPNPAVPFCCASRGSGWPGIRAAWRPRRACACRVDVRGGEARNEHCSPEHYIAACAYLDIGRRSARA